MPISQGIYRGGPPPSPIWAIYRNGLPFFFLWLTIGLCQKCQLTNRIFRRSSAVEQVTVRTLWYTLKCMPDKRTYADRAEYIKKAVAKRRRTMRQRAVEYKGGRCSQCGYNKCSDALEFHHHDGRKDFGISQDGLTRSWERIEKELKKCILICANCHREEHTKLRSLAEKSVSEE